MRVDSKDNPADSFTKPNGAPVHVNLLTKTVGYNMNFLNKNWHTARDNAGVTELKSNADHPGNGMSPGELRGSIGGGDFLTLLDYARVWLNRELIPHPKKKISGKLKLVYFICHSYTDIC